jgi:hypothetical protein
MAKKPRTDDRAAKARFIFEGTVRKAKATTMKSVAATDRTVVVCVDRIIAAPEALTDFAGQQVTVEVGEGEEAVTPGQAYVFYTDGWIFGEGLAVRSAGHEKAVAAAAAAASVHPGDPVRSLESRRASARAADAALIVSGRVSAVRLPEAEARARAAVAAGTATTTTEPISEHAPIWQEAVIDVDKVHRGKLKAKQVVVRFPSSTDVRWYRAPKFHAGQEGVFLLHEPEPEARPAAKGRPKAKAASVAASAGAGAAVKPGEYTALDPADVQPLDELQRIMAATKADRS